MLWACFTVAVSTKKNKKNKKIDSTNYRKTQALIKLQSAGTLGQLIFHQGKDP